jgi:hypothetical protein
MFTTKNLDLLATYTDKEIAAYYQGYSLAMEWPIPDEQRVAAAVALVRTMLERA